MRGLRLQFSSALLMILTVAAVVSAVINFQQQDKFHLPDDGVTWVDRDHSVTALYVAPGSPAAKAGLRSGDVLLKIKGSPIEKATDVMRALVSPGVGAWSKPPYKVRRGGVEFETPVVIAEGERDAVLYYQYLVGFAYLAIGLFVYFRRGNADKAGHFYVLCLASFVLSTFHSTGKLNTFDMVIDWGNRAAGLFAPTIFLHFCLAFPRARKRLLVLMVYLPATLLMLVFLGVGTDTLRISSIPLIDLRWLLDRVWLSFLAAVYLAGGAILAREHRRETDPMVRQQLKWLRNGAILGVGPFAAFYVLPYALGAIPAEYMKAAVLSLLLIPLTWAWAILRYRLMDVDVIFQQGSVYTLATICVLGIFYGLFFSVLQLRDLGPTSIATLIVIAALLFQPIRNWIQEQMDRNVFFKESYDYRATLIEFARELSSETDLDKMLSSVSDRLIRTLSLRRLAVFVSKDAAERFELRRLVERGEDGKTLPVTPPAEMDLSFLTDRPDKSYFFFEQTRHLIDVRSRELPRAVRQTIAALDFTYYLPCSVRGRTIAYLGVSRTDKGDFLTSEDLELLVTISGYVGIAIENARLYRSLERKVAEYERLKEYSENIVESINVGILAVDLDDRVESWNSQLEVITGIPRDFAVGRTLADLFPSDLVQELAGNEEDQGIRHIYKFVLRTGSSQNVIEFPANGNGHSEAPKEPVTSERETILNLAIAPLIARDFEQIGRLVIFDDVTERDDLERRLVQADKLSSIGLLAAGVAHEVNTPLAVISTYAQMLTKQVSGDEQKSRLLEKIAKQTFRASEIVNSLLNFSRTSPTTFDDVDLNRIVHECLPLIQHQMEKVGITVQLDLEEQVPAIKGNAGKLQQVFLNLFLNARDAMLEGGTLVVRSHSKGDSVGVDVIDTGHGISPEYLDRIFDPFFTTKAARKGTGLGLSVTYGIVREHGGVIEVESQPGEGTRFHLEFPLVRKAVHA